jgi:hypothetical protein
MPRMPQMFGKPSIRSKLLLGLAVPVAAVVLLGVAAAAGAWSDRAGAREDGRTARVAGLALAAVHELQEERVRAVAWAAGRGRDDEAELSRPAPRPPPGRADTAGARTGVVWPLGRGQGGT